MSILKSFVALTAVTVTSPAFAGIMFDIRTFNGGTETGSFTVGDTITVSVFANDTAAGSGPDFTTDTITGFETTLTATADDAADAASVAAATFNIGFDSGIGGGTFTRGAGIAGSDFTSTEGVEFTAASGPFGGIATPATPLHLLSFSYTAGAIGSRSFAFGPVASQMFSFNDAFGVPMTLDGTNESFTFDGAALTVSAVPEPSGIAVLALAGVGLIGRRRKRSRVG